MASVIEAFYPGDRLPKTVAAAQTVVGGDLLEYTAAGTVQKAGADSVLVAGVAAQDGAAGEVITVYTDGVVPILNSSGSTINPGERLVAGAAGTIKKAPTGGGGYVQAETTFYQRVFGHATEAIATATVGLVKLTL